jgi:hypothetical protein
MSNALRRLAAISALAALPVSCVPLEARKAYPPQELPAFRAPAVPLVVQSPYLNVWLFGDQITDDSPKLWNGQVKGMAGLLRIDGKPYRFLGMPGSPLPAMKQEAVRVWPTRTEFELLAEDVRLKLEFLSPIDPRDLETLSLPLVLVRVEVASRTGRQVQLHLDITGEWAVGSTDRRLLPDGHFRIRPTQPRIFHETSSFSDWGDVHWSAVDPAVSQNGVDRGLRQAFVEGVSPGRDVRYPRAANDDWPVFSHAWDLGLVTTPVVRRAILAHVRREAVQFFGSSCLSYWTRTCDDGDAIVARTAASFEQIRSQCLTVDAEVLARARAAGGDSLAALAALSFRQTFAANELVLLDNRPVYVSKSPDLSGSSPLLAVETIYAAAPALLAFNPKLLALQVAPILDAHRRGHWNERHAMRDLGYYPNAAGLAGPDENRIETTAMLLLLSALVRQDDPRALEDHHGDLHRLGAFLADSSTPELWWDKRAGAAFETHAVLASILALATLPEFRTEAEARMKRWIAEASVGDHTSLTFGDAKSWSLQPHLLMDRLLGLRLVPDAIMVREAAFARTRAGRYGASPDSRRGPVAVDALLRIAALSPRAGAEAWAADLLRALNETPTRVPAGDRVDPDSARITGGQARPTLGSVFAAVLMHERAPAR